MSIVRVIMCGTTEIWEICLLVPRDGVALALCGHARFCSVRAGVVIRLANECPSRRTLTIPVLRASTSVFATVHCFSWITVETARFNCFWINVESHYIAHETQPLSELCVLAAVWRIHGILMYRVPVWINTFHCNNFAFNLLFFAVTLQQYKTT